MGHLIDDEAAKIASTIDPSRFNSGPVAAALTGQIAAIDGRNIIINIGSSAGVQVGQTFDIVKVKSLVDPTTHASLHVNENVGRLQIDSVSPSASVGHVVSGKAAVRLTVTSSRDRSGPGDDALDLYDARLRQPVVQQNPAPEETERYNKPPNQEYDK